jgi:hypothetical protein
MNLQYIYDKVEALYVGLIMVPNYRICHTYWSNDKNKFMHSERPVHLYTVDLMDKFMHSKRLVHLYTIDLTVMSRKICLFQIKSFFLCRMSRIMTIYNICNKCFFNIIPFIVYYSIFFFNSFNLSYLFLNERTRSYLTNKKRN